MQSKLPCFLQAPHKESSQNRTKIRGTFHFYFLDYSLSLCRSHFPYRSFSVSCKLPRLKSRLTAHIGCRSISPSTWPSSTTLHDIQRTFAKISRSNFSSPNRTLGKQSRWNTPLTWIWIGIYIPAISKFVGATKKQTRKTEFCCLGILRILQNLRSCWNKRNFECFWCGWITIVKRYHRQFSWVKWGQRKRQKASETTKMYPNEQSGWFLRIFLPVAWSHWS